MSSRDKTPTATTGSSNRVASSKATARRVANTSSNKKSQQQARLKQSSAATTSASASKERGKKDSSAPPTSNKVASNSSGKQNNPVIGSAQPTRLKSESSAQARHRRTPVGRRGGEGGGLEQKDESSSSSQEMTMTSLQGESPRSDLTHGANLVSERETNIDRAQQQDTDEDESTTLLESCSSDIVQPSTCGTSRPSALPAGWEERTDKQGVYFWHVATGVIQRTRPTEDKTTQLVKESLVLYHDDEEINQSSTSQLPRRTSSDESDEYLESGAALTAADEPTTISDAITFVVYPTGCCEFDETQLISANSTKAIQKCILKLAAQSASQMEAGRCWGLDQSQPILMRLLDDHIQFSDLDTRSLIRSQPIQTIKTWAVDDENNFAFVVEDQHDQLASRRDDNPDEQSGSACDSVDYALLNGPTFLCYVFSSTVDDDMSSKVADKLNAELARYRELMSHRASKSTRLQQMMIETNPIKKVVAQSVSGLMDNDQTDADEDFDDAITAIGGEDGDDEDLEEDSSETSIRVRYIGKVQVPRPMGIDVLNVAIDKSLAEASKAQMNRLLSSSNNTGVDSPNTAHSSPAKTTSSGGQLEIGSPLTDAKIHISPSSVIVENEQTGDIIVECRIRYLTFMGISRRDIRWCGFIMQNTTNKTFEAHCIECAPTAGLVCETIQASCSRMYEKMVKGQRRKQQLDEAVSIMPKTSKIRDTLAKTFSKIKLAPIIQ